ncbi:MAG TPA: hypothetical protein VGN16_09775 [Acidobacteriaceae bacterium]|jgi:hypothetical protein
MNFSDITTLCREVSKFGLKQNYTFKALPVIVWEFDEPNQFLDARMMLERSIHEDMAFLHRGNIVREIGPFCIELDAAAVTFRLECRHYQWTQAGQKGIAELKPGADFIEKPRWLP